MFSAKLQEGVLLKRIVDAIKDVVGNINMEIGPNGLSFQAMDTTHIALVTLSLKAEGFNQFRCDRQFPIGLKLPDLHKILKCADANDSIKLECEADPSSLQIVFESSKHERKSVFNLNLVHFDQESLQIPETNYSSKVSLPAGQFSKMIRELSQLSESIKISTNKKSINFAISGEACSGEIELKENPATNSAESVCIDVDDPVSNSFSLKFLNSFCKGDALAESVNLMMSENTPLVVEYKIADIGHLKFYLAPKINEEN